MSETLDFLLQLLSQFAGGPGPMENNLVRFGLQVILWGALLLVGWSRQRRRGLRRDRLLVWGFGLGFAGALVMAVFVSLQMMNLIEREAAYAIVVPLEHALSMAAIAIIAGAFLDYILDEPRLARSYLQIGLGLTVICLVLALWQWPRYLATYTEDRFHETWGAWLFHVPLSVLLVVAIVFLRRKRDWLSNVVSIVLALFFLGELLLLLSFATDRNYSHIFCPISNSLHILAIPLLGYVFLREQAIEKRQAERELEKYHEHLEDLVKERTAEVTTVNAQLKQEILERRQAEEALELLSRRNELILESAGEGICGIDHQGRFIFVNPAAARMLGYPVEELVGQPCHAIWHHSTANDSPYPEENCPIYAGYAHGIAGHGDDQLFWRQDNTGFPVLYVSSPTYENGTLTGAVVVFRDITERKQAEAKIAQRNARLAAQNAVAATLSRSLELETILNSALEVVLSVLEMEVGLVFLLDADAEGLVLKSCRGQVTQDKAQGSEQDWSCCEGLSTRAVIGLRPVVHSVSDYPARNPESNIVREGLELLVSTPLVSKGRALGALTLGSRQVRAVQQPELELLTAIGQQIGLAIENARLYQATERSAEGLTLLHQVSISLTSTFDSAKIYEQIAEQSVKLLDCEMACILAWDREHQGVVLVSSCGMNEAQGEVLQTQMGSSDVLADLFLSHQSVAIGDVQADPRIPPVWMETLDIRALLCVPIWGTEEPLGYLFLMDQRAPRHWRSEALELIESFVNRAAVALVNANLHKQLEWAAALEERQRIAADMHDGLAQTVSALGLEVDQTADLVANGPSREAEERLGHIREIVGQVSVDVRRSIASLKEAPQPRCSLQEMLSDLPNQLPLSAGPAIALTFREKEPLFLPLEQGGEAALVVQEALLNARRHAQAKRIALLLERQGQQITIAVKDDGRGFDPSGWWKNSQVHFGLSIMHARAARIGGRLQIDSAPGQGTRVLLIFQMDSDSYRAQCGDIPMVPATLTTES